MSLFNSDSEPKPFDPRLLNRSDDLPVELNGVAGAYFQAFAVIHMAVVLYQSLAYHNLGFAAGLYQVGGFKQLYQRDKLALDFKLYHQVPKINYCVNNDNSCRAIYIFVVKRAVGSR